MNVSEDVGRWPPIYDFEELGQQIKGLIDDESIFYQFFVPHINTDEMQLFQGDIVLLKNNPVFIDKDGDVSIIEGEFNYWVILGNTCDLARDLTTEIPHLTHISPLIPVPHDTPESVRSNLKKYKLFKKVFIPKWNNEENDYYIDLTIISSIERQCLINHSEIMARLNFQTWLLLHSCLVRYLARDDGRHD